MRDKAYDFRQNKTVDYEAKGIYSTDLLTDEAVDIIEHHSVSNDPMFIYLPYQALHAPLEAPLDEYETIE